MKKNISENKSKVISIAGIVGAAVGLSSGIVTLFTNDTVRTIAQLIACIFIAIFLVSFVIFVFYYFRSYFSSNEIIESISSEVNALDKKVISLEEKVTSSANTIQDIKNLNQQIQIEVCKQKTDQGNKICPVVNSAYVESSEEVNHHLFNILKNRDIEKLCIICFGRRGFGGLVNWINEKKIETDVSIIVFNPEAQPSICRDDDKDIIERNIKDWLKDSNNTNKKTEIFVSDIPPMIRAAVAYSKDNTNSLRAVWGTLQSYRFASRGTSSITLEKPPASLISVCDEERTTAADFQSLVRCFEEEFERLKKASHIPYVANDGHGRKSITYKDPE